LDGFSREIPIIVEDHRIIAMGATWQSNQIHHWRQIASYCEFSMLIVVSILFVLLIVHEIDFV